MQHPNTPAEAIIMVGDLFADTNHWTTGADARDSDGRRVDPLSPKAVAWSLDGALARVIDVDAEDTPDEEHWRRLEVQRGAYYALGIGPGCDFQSLETTMVVLRHGEVAARRAELQSTLAA